MKAKRLSPEEKLVILMVSSSRHVCAYAYMSTLVHFYCTLVLHFLHFIVLLHFLFARASWGARGSIGYDSSDCSVFELRFRASNTQFIESPLGIRMTGFR